MADALRAAHVSRPQGCVRVSGRMSGGEKSVVDDGGAAVAARAGPAAVDASADQYNDGTVNDTALKGVSSRLHGGAPSDNNARDETTWASCPGQR